MKKFIKVVLGVTFFITTIIFIILFLVYSSKKVDTNFDDEDYNSFINKFNLNESDEKLSISDLNNKKAVGKNKVEINSVTITASELASFLNKRVDKNIIHNTNVGFDTNSIILTFKTGKQIDTLLSKGYSDIISLIKDKNIYWDFTVTNLFSKELLISTNNLYVGKIRIPDKYSSQISKHISEALNNLLNEINMIEIREIKVDGNGLTFDGAIPKEIDFE